MQDRFKLRVFDKENNEFLKEYEDDGFFENFAITNKGELVKLSHAVFYPSIDYLDDDNFIAQQCTGLKDCEGKLIYEGDILEYQFKDIHGKSFKKRLGFVFWDVYQFSIGTFKSQTRATWVPNKRPDRKIGLKKIFSAGGRVIGNIYETPELLEVQDASK